MTELDRNKHTVSIIIINYNSYQFTVACIESIIAKVDCELSYDIIVVDNNSKNADYAKLASLCGTLPNVTLIRSVINLGFSGGNMLGVQHAHADYLLFLNNDTTLLNDNVSLYLDFMLKHPDAGICTGQMYNGDGAFVTSFQHFPSVAQRIFGANMLRLLFPEKYPDNRRAYTEPQKVDVVAGSAMFVDYRKFAGIGGFDTNFFLYCEEEDIAIRLHKAGYSAYLLPDAKYLHYVGKSTTRNFDIDKEFYISYFYYIRKHLSRMAYLSIVLYSFLKNLKSFYKGAYYLQLAFFILSFPGQEHSLKHEQKMRIDLPVTRSHILNSTATNICDITESVITYSICTLVTSESEYNGMRRSFERAGFTEKNSEYLFVDNTQHNSLDAYAAYRKFSLTAKGTYIIYCHQDVLAIDTVNTLEERIRELEQLDPLWAIAGNAGASAIKSFYKYFVNGDNENEFVGSLPAKVTSLDEDFLVIKRETGLSTSADLSGFHFYATDLCINADILGYSSYVIKYLVQHKSDGNMGEAFWVARDLFIQKYARALRTRVIQTTCIKLVVAGNRVINYLANKSAALLVIKVFIKAKNNVWMKP